MAKEKKISVKYYVKYSSKPLVVDGEEEYPIYVQVIYNRETTRFMIKDKNDKEITTKMKNLSPSQNLLTQLSINQHHFSYNPENIQQIIRFESTHFFSDYTLKGLSNRIIFYNNQLVYRSLGIYEALKDFLIEQRKIRKNSFNDFEAKFDYKYYLLMFYYYYGSIARGMVAFNELFHYLVKGALLLDLFEPVRIKNTPYSENDGSYALKVIDWIIEDVPSKLRKFVSEANLNPLNSDSSDFAKEIYSVFNLKKNEVNIYIQVIENSFYEKVIMHIYQTTNGVQLINLQNSHLKYMKFKIG